MSIEGALKAGLDGSDTALTADPDGDGIDNFGEWAFGTNPAKADSEVSATALVLVQPETGDFRFAHRRLVGFSGYQYQASDNLSSWEPVTVTEESASPLPSSPGYEVVTLSLSPSNLVNRDRLFLKIVAQP